MGSYPLLPGGLAPAVLLGFLVSRPQGLVALLFCMWGVACGVRGWLGRQEHWPLSKLQHATKQKLRSFDFMSQIHWISC